MSDDDDDADDVSGSAQEPASLDETRVRMHAMLDQALALASQPHR